MTDISVPQAIIDGASPDHVSTELSARRTGMSFQRTRMSADRTLMSAIRTSLALISFGFTIYQFFQHLRDENAIVGAHAARSFGAALIYLGVGMILAGIAFHAQFMLALRQQREEMTRDGLIHGQSHFPVSYTLIVAILLLLLGLAAIASVSFGFGPLR
ncbi:MAG TPA: DUF202 domain-containing protein [Gemmatimonadaceae bacterium]|jgi:putative membrane protein